MSAFATATGSQMRWWNREFSRQMLVMPLIVPALFLPGETLLKVLAGWDLYFAGYLLLTWLTFRRRSPEELREVVLTTSRQGLAGRWLQSTPEQFAQGAAMIALFATVSALPQAETLGAPPKLALAICVVAVITAWLALQTGFVISYLALHARSGGFDFPGTDEPGLVDFAYFAVSVGTTFGTTDVTVTQSRVRRRVLAHATLAFVFNTLILATAVTFVTSYLTT
ncbi:DUF1345 domain-containing protein [Kribbella sandramycini]|uniref:DUF1345 domain-containing protein n=1 Tax=Kribbella sandramycini TaxID=60450 RepID=A0A7Y4P161_9ACTN|nr:DUF1345 domain-containing protein [Kribbella sandramycini]MBB6570767.1 putative membrane protein [Kribbella sandramycini]NOL43907.1 DUF1345 domain-containing protein [Kribbella sandramycini]